MGLVHPLHAWGAYHGADDRLHEATIKREICLGNPRNRREPAFIGLLMPAKRANIVKGPRLASHHPIACHQVRIYRRSSLGFEDRFIEPWRQRIEKIDVAR